MTHPADTHDLIRVQGARVNNLKDVSVVLPKRRLTVFTGVSGSGKSSLAFGTIAAESQRLVNETYSAFVQGFLPTTARPDVDVLEGLTNAIVVDQERIGSNPRSTVGPVTDAHPMLRIVFRRLGRPQRHGAGVGDGLHHGRDEAVELGAPISAHHLDHLGGKVARRHDPGRHRVFEVVADIGDAIRPGHHLSFGRLGGRTVPRVVPDGVELRPGERGRRRAAHRPGKQRVAGKNHAGKGEAQRVRGVPGRREHPARQGAHTDRVAVTDLDRPAAPGMRRTREDPGTIAFHGIAEPAGVVVVVVGLSLIHI